MKTALCIAGILTLTSAPVTAGCDGSRLVRVGRGCMSLPCGWRSVAARQGIDASGGYFRARDEQEEVDWLLYDGSFLFAFQNVDRVVWRRLTIHHWNLWWVALVEISGKRTVMTTNGSMWLMSDAGAPDAVSRLESLAASYRTDIEVSSCEAPEELAP